MSSNLNDLPLRSRAKAVFGNCFHVIWANYVQITVQDWSFESVWQNGLPQ
jgi:hypothetical protein